ncbi:MAG: hypothetical protein C4545_04055 [Anaerolineaceae bacterium]|jgi:hypothetical protein|nr:MAG: hypothetical protein C4545_04055 [Anaerolineaceae bacterium]
MKTNTALTIYNRYIDATTRTEKYQRTVIPAVFWENRKAANVIKSGLLAADQASVYVPFTAGINHLEPAAWQALTSKTGKWTIAIGDAIVKGDVTDEIEGSFTITSLKAKYDDVLIITSVDAQDYGSVGMQHWQIGAK